MNRGTFDLFFDQIVKTLEAHSLAQPEAERYKVLAEVARTDVSRDPVLVFVTPTRISGEHETVNSYAGISADYEITMIVRSIPGKSAGLRLRHLSTQVIEALFPNGNRRLGMATGLVSRAGFSVSFFYPEDQQTERQIVGAKMNISAHLGWTPESKKGTPFTDLKVDAQKWSAIFKKEINKNGN